MFNVMPISVSSMGAYFMSFHYIWIVYGWRQTGLESFMLHNSPFEPRLARGLTYLKILNTQMRILSHYVKKDL